MLELLISCGEWYLGCGLLVGRLRGYEIKKAMDTLVTRGLATFEDGKYRPTDAAVICWRGGKTG